MSQNEIPTYHILVVDDTSLARQMVCRFLHGLGMTNVAEAANGKLAFAQIRQAYDEGKPFDLILCDWVMPEMDGGELFRLCRATPEFKTLPFIMITAEGAKDKIFNTLGAGAADYLLKPFTPAQFKAKVLNMIAQISTKSA